MPLARFQTSTPLTRRPLVCKILEHYANASHKKMQQPTSGNTISPHPCLTALGFDRIEIVIALDRFHSSPNRLLNNSVYSLQMNTLPNRHFVKREVYAKAQHELKTIHGCAVFGCDAKLSNLLSRWEGIWNAKKEP